jgi:hypothetical protein
MLDAFDEMELTYQITALAIRDVGRKLGPDKVAILNQLAGELADDYENDDAGFDRDPFLEMAFRDLSDERGAL